MLLKPAVLASAAAALPIPGPPVVLSWGVDVAADNHSFDISGLGIQPGDFILSFLHKQSTITVPLLNVAGTSMTRHLWSTTNGVGFAVFSGFASSTGTTITLGDQNQASVLSIFRLKNVSLTTQIHALTSVATGNDDTAEVPGLTTTENDTLIFRAFTGDLSNILNDDGFPGGHTNYYVRDGLQDGSKQLSAGAAALHQATAGAVGPATFTFALGSMPWVAVSVAISSKNPAP